MRRVASSPSLAASAITCLLLLIPACSETDDGDRTLVASFYPLAFVAERIAAPEWDVIDLTPPDVEPHDVELTLEDRSLIEEADLVFYMGPIGFQPQLEDAVEDAGRPVYAASEHTVFERLPTGDLDPHVWLNPDLFSFIADQLAIRLGEVDPERQQLYADRVFALDGEFRVLRKAYRVLRGCPFRTAIVSHEAFNYVFAPYRVEQFGLSGLEPEGEPLLSRLAEAERLIREGEAGSVFYDPSADARRIAQQLAEDNGVPALPLSTLESRPPSGGYMNVMLANLESLREGLGCG